MKKSVYILSLFLFLIYTGCEKSMDVIDSFISTSDTTSSTHMTTTDTVNAQVDFYLTDSLGQIQKEFYVGQDIFFNMDIINNRDTAMYFHKSHGGPPLVRFYVFKDDTLFGISDEGYLYVAILGGGYVPPDDTLTYSISWYSNPYHQNFLDKGTYYSTIDPYIWFDDFNLSSQLDTVYLEVVSK